VHPHCRGRATADGQDPDRVYWWAKGKGAAVLNHNEMDGHVEFAPEHICWIKTVTSQESYCS